MIVQGELGVQEADVKYMLYPVPQHGSKAVETKSQE
jgi:hypothetical protein